MTRSGEIPVDEGLEKAESPMAEVEESADEAAEAMDATSEAEKEDAVEEEEDTPMDIDEEKPETSQEPDQEVTNGQPAEGDGANEAPTEAAAEKAASETSSEAEGTPPDKTSPTKMAENENDEMKEQVDDSVEAAKEAEQVEGGESSSKDVSDSAARSTKSQPVAEENSAPMYSTRGRHQKEEEEGILDRKSRDLDHDREPPITTTGAVSFLEALSEEDRRTRTRHLPDVEGFTGLHKSEIKSDLALARSVVSSTGVTSKLSSRRPKAKKPSAAGQKDDGQMDVDEEEGTGPSEDERASDIVGVGGPVIDLDNKEFPVPSSVFVAPKNGDAEGFDGPTPVLSSKQLKNQTRSPFVVEAIKAWGPPRPPESVGAKKKHRMLRWERRPQDVELDLANYRKTVQRTGEELRNAGKERERIQTFGAILRVHYRDQLENFNEESVQLNEELGSIQTECVSAADLLTSRTRSRGAGKGSYLMRDVISVLKARGAELKEKGLPGLAPEKDGSSVPGLGGVSSYGFADWDRTHDVPEQKLSSAWTLPGDTVTTPYGDGVALHVFGPSVLNVKESLPFDLRPKPPPPVEPPVEAPVESGENGNKDGAPELPSTPEKESKVLHGFGTDEKDSDVVMETETTPKTEAESKPSKAAHETEAAGKKDAAVEKEAEPAGEKEAANENGAAGKEGVASEKEAVKDVPTDPGAVKSSETVGDSIPKESDKKVDKGDGSKKPAPEKQKPKTPTPEKQKPKTPTPERPASEDAIKKEYHMDQILLPRVAVRLSFGIGFFPVNFVESKENPSSYPDSMLASRWKKIVETASMVGSSLDVAGMASVSQGTRGRRLGTSESSMNIDEAAAENDAPGDAGAGALPDPSDAADDGEAKSASRLVPFGSSMLPTSVGRGCLLAEAPITSLESPINDHLLHNGGVLGLPDNPGVPEPTEDWESVRQDSYTLQAKVLHLRNELRRQRRIRSRNERLYSTFRDRSLRAEALVSEMRSDLSSLKDRLGDEVGELGIDGEKAEGLLSSHFKEKDSGTLTGAAAPPPKRTTRVAKEVPPPTMKMTRRRRAESSDFGLDEQFEDSATNEDKGISGEDAGNALSSDEDIDNSHRPKRARYAQ